MMPMTMMKRMMKESIAHNHVPQTAFQDRSRRVLSCSSYCPFVANRPKCERSPGFRAERAMIQCRCRLHDRVARPRTQIRPRESPILEPQTRSRQSTPCCPVCQTRRCGSSAATEMASSGTPRRGAANGPPPCSDRRTSYLWRVRSSPCSRSPRRAERMSMVRCGRRTRQVLQPPQGDPHPSAETSPPYPFVRSKSPDVGHSPVESCTPTPSPWSTCGWHHRGA